MTFNKIGSISYCVGGKHYSGTDDIAGEITSKRTGEEIE